MVFANRLPLPASPEATAPAKSAMLRFGWTREEVHGLLMPMAASGKEAIGSMGRDTPLAVLSSQARPLFDYFSQQFAQVTNPPLDAIREQLVTSLQSNLGGCRNLFEERAEHARVVQLQQPVVTEAEITMISSVLPTQTIATVFDEPDKQGSLEDALDAVVLRALEAVDAGTRVLVLSDVAANSTLVPIPALLALGAVHHALVDAGKRLSCSLIVDSGEIREVHHVCLLIGYGASAVRPRLALQWARHAASGLDITAEDAERNVLKALSAGLLKVMSKMGISTVHSYRGAQLFEAVGLGDAVINRCFKGTVSRLGGVDFDDIAADYARFRERSSTEKGQAELPVGGHYTWRRTGEKQGLNPGAVANLQLAVRTGVSDHYDAWATSLNTLEGRPTSLRGLLDIAPSDSKPVPIEDVEPWTEIVQRFKTGAMSYGSISREAHETLATAMNQLGGKSNTGEGGEDPERYDRAHPARSRIKQIASGRFGVTIDYLSSADEIQIKMAQGAKPGEGGQLPAHKVYPDIARTRHSTPWVGLISPPPHHDIYSIEDLAQLIFDLRNANPEHGYQ